MSIINVATAPSTVTTAGACTQTTAAITSTTSVALAANANRKRAILLNPPTATTTVYLSFTGTATVANSLPLAPGQGWVDENNVVHLGAFSAITASGTGSLLCFDWS